jgi:hypothetical protein
MPIALTDTDKRTPYRGENGADQNIEWIIAKRTAVSAHFYAQGADFMMAGGIEQTRQHH